MFRLNNCAALIMLVLLSFSAHALETVVIKKETPEYLLDIKYPQGFGKNNDQLIKDKISKIKKSFMAELIEDASVPADAPGKTGLNIRFSIPYNAKNALSVQLDSSIFHRGAAHPAQTISVLNFINGQPVALSDLFKPNTEFLKPIAAFCHKAITQKDISEPEMITEGTAPLNKNYKVWYFTKQGIAIIFNTYQVAAYVYGEQQVEIPFSVYSSMVKPEISKQLWGN